jgi:Protein of unknown function (DUF3667)
MTVETAKCGTCETLLVGEYCHGCGQRRLSGRLTGGAFIADVVKRVMRVDVALVSTFWRSLRAPGQLVNDYLAGRRAGMLDPLQYFISSIFIQIIVSGITTAVAPLLQRDSATSWLGQLGGMVAIKILFILWVGTLWRAVFRSREFGLGAIYVFTTYAMATTGVLWSLLPIADLLVPVVLARSEAWVAAITLGIEVIYLTYAVRDWMKRPIWQVLIGVSSILLAGYSILAYFIGVDHAVSFAPLSALLRQV